MKRCLTELDHLISQVYTYTCNEASPVTVSFIASAVHRADGGRGVGVVGGCEVTRGKDIPSEDE